jgi:hypothetical protein
MSAVRTVLVLVSVALAVAALLNGVYLLVARFILGRF